MGGVISPYGTGLPLQATTGPVATPYTLVNGTGNIITWTAPNDGNTHFVYAQITLDVSSGATGGQITLNYTSPQGNSGTPAILAGNQTAGAHVGNQSAIVAPGTTSAIAQNSALTAGAAKLAAQIWGI